MGHLTLQIMKRQSGTHVPTSICLYNNIWDTHISVSQSVSQTGSQFNEADPKDDQPKYFQTYKKENET